MGATLDELAGTARTIAAPRLADLTTVGRVNDLAYGNYDARLERTLAPLPNGILKGYRADLARQAGGRRAGPAPRRGLRRLVRRHDPEGAPQGPRLDRHAPGAGRRARQRLHDDDAAGHGRRRAAVHEPRLPAPVRDAAVGAAAVSLNPALEDAKFCPRCGSPPRSPSRAASAAPSCGYGAFYNPKPVACAIPATDGGELFLMRRGFEPSRGLWTMPGGFVDLGESVEDAAIRETKEEIGVDIEITSLVGVYSRSTDRIVVVVYAARAQGTRGGPRRRSKFEPSGRPLSHGTSWRSGATVARCATTCTQRRRTPPPPARPDRPPRAGHRRRRRRHVRRRVRRAEHVHAVAGPLDRPDRDLHRARAQGRARPVRAAGGLGRAVRGRDPAARPPPRRPADGRPRRVARVAQGGGFDVQDVRDRGPRCDRRVPARADRDRAADLGRRRAARRVRRAATGRARGCDTRSAPRSRRRSAIGIALVVLLPPRGQIDEPQYYAFGPDIPRALQAVEAAQQSTPAARPGARRAARRPRPAGHATVGAHLAGRPADDHDRVRPAQQLPRAARSSSGATNDGPLFFAGDLTDRGSPLESRLVSRVVGARQAVVFVSGNHDSRQPRARPRPARGGRAHRARPAERRRHATAT